MSGSWGHAVRALTESEREHLARMNERWGGGQECQVKSCLTPAEFMTSYRYVTGKGGRISEAERRSCPEHARRFAEKYGCEMPTEAVERVLPQTRTGTEADFE